MPLRPTILGPALLLLAFSAGLAGVSQVIFPKRIPWVQDWANMVENKAAEDGIRVIDLAAMKAIVDKQSHILLDARRMGDYLAGHIPGAFALPDAEFDANLPNVLPLLTPSQPIVTYCSGKSCDESIHLTKKLQAQGFTNIVLFAGGIVEWKEAGHPVQQ